MSDQEKSTNNEHKTSTDTTKKQKEIWLNESAQEDTQETDGEKTSKDAKPTIVITDKYSIMSNPN